MVDLPVISDVTGLRPTLARVSLWTSNAAALENFYAELFGFKRAAFTTIGSDDRGAAILRAWNLDAEARLEILLMRSPRGDTEIGITSVTSASLVAAPSVRDGSPQSGSTYLVLYVPDLDVVISLCRAQSIDFNRAPKRLYGPDGRCYYEMAIYDPDGRVLLVVEDVAPVAG